MAAQNLKDLSVAELEAWLAARGEPAYRARQVFHWLHRRAVCSFEVMTDLPASLRARLAAEASPGCAAVRRRLEDPRDGTVKLLLELADGQAVEAVGLRYRFGLTACVSTQVGCRMGCAFCASTVGGLVRHLTPGEMVEQVLAVGRDAGEGARVGRVVFMGIGEPLDNYEALVKALRLLHAPEGLGLSYRHLTVSTCGLVPEMRRLAGEGLPVNLAVSLHAPEDELRTRLVPVNRRYPLAEVLAAAGEYGERTGRRVTFEYALIAGVNDHPELARSLARRLAGVRGPRPHVNLIPLNPTGRGHQPSPPERVRAFRDVLARAGVAVTVRRALGSGIHAACGQLRRAAGAGRGGAGCG